MINFATASHAELEASGFTVDVRRSQATWKRKSAFGVRPSINKDKMVTKRTLANANETARGTMRG